MPLSTNEYIPQVIPTRRPFVVWLIIASGALIFVSLIIAAPFLAAGGHASFAINIYHSFSILCHQLPERSYFVTGHKLAVCSRCTGLYFGATLTLLLYPWLRSLRVVYAPPRKWLIAAAVPLFIDFLLTFVAVWQNTHTTRFITGFIFGSVVVFYVMPGVIELSLRSWKRHPTRNEVPPVAASPLPVGPSDYSAPERRI